MIETIRSLIWKLRKPQPVRRLLPARRHSETFDIDIGLRDPATVTAGYYPDGEVGEAFIDAGKAGEQIAAIARDAAVTFSMALQYGAPLEVIANALTRDGRNQPCTIIGHVVDKLARDQGIVIKTPPAFGDDGNV